MPSCKITKRAVESIRPAERDVLVWDTELRGFGCKVTPAGRRVYFLYYRTTSGQQRKPTIGDHGRLSAEQARAVARQWLAAAERGEDPSGDRKEARKAETVAELSDRYLSEYAAHHKKASSAATDRSNVENHVKPLLGRLKVRDVTRADIERAKLAIRTGKTPANKDRALPRPRGRRIVKGGPGVANRVIALLSKMFERAEAWGLRGDNPVRRIEKYRENPRKRFLNAAELMCLHGALAGAEHDGSETTAAIAAIRLLLYTGARLGEITGLRWREVDFEHGCFRLSDSKTGEGIIPLGSAALAVVASLDRGKPDDLVIESAKRGARIALTNPWHRIRAAAEIGADVTLHSLRHTFASWSVMGGFTTAQTGAVLRHKSAQTTMGYEHHELDSQRRTAESVSGAIAATANANRAPVVPLKSAVG
jgi:integrase